MDKICRKQDTSNAIHYENLKENEYVYELENLQSLLTLKSPTVIGNDRWKVTVKYVETIFKELLNLLYIIVFYIKYDVIGNSWYLRSNCCFCQM